MNAREHKALTGHERYRYLSLDELFEAGRAQYGREPEGTDAIPDHVASCVECGWPICQSSLIDPPETYYSYEHWKLSLHQAFYVYQVEMQANGHDVLPILGEEVYVIEEVL